MSTVHRSQQVPASDLQQYRVEHARAATYTQLPQVQPTFQAAVSRFDPRPPCVSFPRTVFTARGSRPAGYLFLIVPETWPGSPRAKTARGLGGPLPLLHDLVSLTASAFLGDHQAQRGLVRPQLRVSLTSSRFRP